MDEQQPAMEVCPINPAAQRSETGELAESKLRRSGYLAMQHLSCEFRAGVLILRGRLPSYYLKQVASAVVATVEGVQRIDDQVEVAAHAAVSASSRSGQHNGHNPRNETSSRKAWKESSDERSRYCESGK